MEDMEIIDLYFCRSEEAIAQTSQKYGGLCHRIAWNILQDNGDAEECVNESYLALWNQIPPNRPQPLKTNLCKIVRNIALKRFRDNHTQKRNHLEVSFEELNECLPANQSVGRELEAGELTSLIAAFLGSLAKEKRIMFVKRYWLCESVREIAEEFHISERHASVTLGRIRKKLKEYLEREEWI